MPVGQLGLSKVCASWTVGFKLSTRQSLEEVNCHFLISSSDSKGLNCLYCLWKSLNKLGSCLTIQCVLFILQNVLNCLVLNNWLKKLFLFLKKKVLYLLTLCFLIFVFCQKNRTWNFWILLLSLTLSYPPSSSWHHYLLWFKKEFRSLRPFLKLDFLSIFH